jgi:hypothetical protein
MQILPPSLMNGIQVDFMVWYRRFVAQAVSTKTHPAPISVAVWVSSSFGWDYVEEEDQAVLFRNRGSGTR